MKIIRDIPDIYCDLIEEGLYKPKDDRLSVTDLMNPPLIKYLKIKHWDKLESKASEYLWMILGSAVHSVFEKSGIVKQLKGVVDKINNLPTIMPDDIVTNTVELNSILAGHFAEKSIEVTIKGQLIRGRIDFRETGIIKDFKITSVWSFLHGIKPEWEAQLNMYDFMSKANKIPVDKLYVDAILRDWAKVNTYRDKSYPKIPFVSLECNRWTDKQQYDYILKRIAAYNVEPSECSYHGIPTGRTINEKWERPTTYAVKKPKAKRATRVFDAPEDAAKYMEEHKGLEIEKRLGECTRCLLYCPVRNVCPFVRKDE